MYSAWPPCVCNSRALHIRTKHSPPALAPFAASARGLNPCSPHAVAHLPRRYVGRHGHNLAHRLVPQDSRKCSGKMSQRQMYVGITNTARMHFHQHLISSRLRLRHFFDLPRTVSSRHHRSLHMCFLQPNLMPPIRKGSTTLKCRATHVASAPVQQMLNEEATTC